MKSILVMMTLFYAAAGVSHERDFTVDYAYYNAEFEKVTCAQTDGEAIEVASFNERELSFEKIIVGITLQEAVILANYSAEDGTACRYNATFSIDKRKFHRTLKTKST